MKFLLPLLLFISIFNVSCVSTKKYNELLSRNESMDRRIEKLEIDRKNGEIAAKDLKTTKEKLENTESLLLELNSKYNGLQDTYYQLEKNYDEVVLQNAELLEVTAKEKSSLLKEIDTKQKELEDQAKLLSEREEEIGKSIERISELETTLLSEQLRMDSIQQNISNALFVFGPNDLSIEQKDGKIYVSLSQKLLFKKGSDQIDDIGKNAIIKLAEVLQDKEDINIIVEGHTDSDGKVNSNWDLSTRRATTVVKLLQSSGVNPENLTAAGRALYEPILPNDSDENKSVNRRTEIIISPKLDEIMQLIRSNQ